MTETELTRRKARKTSFPKKNKHLPQIDIQGRTSAQQRNLDKNIAKHLT